MSDLPPVPMTGGSFLRDDATGDLVRVEGPEIDLTPPVEIPPSVETEIPPAEAFTETPDEEE